MPIEIALDPHEISGPARRALNRRASAGSWYTIRGKKGKQDEAEVLIFDEIGYWGIMASQFVEDLNKIDAKTLHVRINSPGGSVFEGVAIYNALLRHKARVVVHVDGIAASIASIIAMAGDEIIMGVGATMMIHRPWSIAIGDSGAMRKEAEILDKLEEALVDVYEKRTSQDRSKIKDWLAAETWFTAKEAVDEKFADSLAEAAEEEEDEANACMAKHFDLSFFSNAPKPKIETVRDLERALREDYGMSRAAAKAIASRGFNAGSAGPCDEVPKAAGDDLKELQAALERLCNTIGG